MGILLQALILLAVIGHVNSGVYAETVQRFHTCDIQIKDLADDGRTMFLQRAIGKERISGVVRSIKTFQLPDSFSVTDFPLPGIDTFVIREWTGGAACCYYYYIITHQKASKRTRFQVISSGRGEGDIAIPKDLTFVEDKPALELCDSFWVPDIVFWPRRQLCHADHPYPTRLIVFDSDLLLWRDIPPNRFKSYYGNKVQETIMSYDSTDANQCEHRFSLAIEIAYYTYMTGASNNELDRVLYEMVPNEYRDKKFMNVPNIRKKIVQRANSFKGVKLWSPK